MGDLLSTGLSGLTAFKNVLTTTGHNITNATTEGYSRQRVSLETQTPQFSGSGYVGSGVFTSSITRLYDSFLSTEFRNSSSAASELDTYYEFASQIDSVLANPTVGLSTALQDFFNAAQDVAADPTSIPARQVMLSEGEALENRFSTMDNLFDDITTRVNNRLADTVTDINLLSENIASLNQKIVDAGGRGQTPNDLLDQRDKLIDQLSSKINVTTSLQDDGSVNVFVGSGQSLVLGSSSNELGLESAGFDASALKIVFKEQTANVDITRFMTGGEMGGIIRFRDEVLNPSINTLGQIAVSLAQNFNDQHANGVDLNGDQGLNFFSKPSVLIASDLGNAGSLTVNFAADISTLTTSDYVLTTDATNTNYTITRLSDNTQTTGLVSAGTITLDGLDVDLSLTAAGDEYRIRPTREGASAFSMSTSDPKDIAIGLPAISSESANNSGTAGLSNLNVSAYTGASLADVALVYNGVTSEYDITIGGVASGSVAYIASTDSGAEYNVTVAGFGDISFTLTGQPNEGDTFTLSDNAGVNFSVGDNRNALLLSNLQTAQTLSDGTASFQDVYGQIVADVGRRTKSAEVNGAAQQGFLNQAIASKDAVSGVNLDEEAANLVRFQQAYQAASQVVMTSRTIFDTLLGAFR
jgi:flagellar hook-associated protein 1